ncbi:MAG: cytidine deaminase [Clostridia bacterium]|nr:cytidine deaminase [Clostridia bacterium]MBT7123048.1 cytidine deaminase [Clostridia bacterium]
MKYDALLEKAKKAKENAYVPYSNFRVGAALLCKNGDVYTGCNVENAAYGPTCCAERVAVFKAVSNGNKEFEAIAVTSDSDDVTYPCGVCRQVLAEFALDMDVISSNKDLENEVLKVEELLPRAFTGKEME